MNIIINAVTDYLEFQKLSNQCVSNGLPPLPLALSYSLNTMEIKYALDLMEKNNNNLVLVKTYAISNTMIYYYRHSNGLCYTVGVYGPESNRMATVS